MKPFFSIVVPCCNVGPYIEECLQSILNQSFQDWECLAVVETSRDNTERIVRDFAEKDDRILFWVLPRSGSASIARNTALDHAQGKYVIFVDGDDYILENSLAKLAEKITSHPDADFYSCAVYAQDMRTGKEKIFDNYRIEDPAELTGVETFRLYLHRSPPKFFPPQSVFRLEFLNQNKLRFVPRMKYEDIEFMPRAMYLAKRIVPIHELYYCYRIRNNSVTTSKYGSGIILVHRSRIIHNLLEFYFDVSKKGIPDPVVSAVWRRWIIKSVCFQWFYPDVILGTSRKRRLCSLRHIFQNSQSFNFLTERISCFQKLKVYMILLALRHPTCGAWFSELFFLCFFQLAEIKASVKKRIRTK